MDGWPNRGRWHSASWTQLCRMNSQRLYTHYRIRVLLASWMFPVWSRWGTSCRLAASSLYCALSTPVASPSRSGSVEVSSLPSRDDLERETHLHGCRNYRCRNFDDEQQRWRMSFTCHHCCCCSFYLVLSRMERFCHHRLLVASMSHLPRKMHAREVRWSSEDCPLRHDRIYWSRQTSRHPSSQSYQWLTDSAIFLVRRLPI